VYYGLLRQLTFHQLNRGYLLVALALAAIYPVLDLGWLRPAVAPAAPLMQVVPAWTEAAGTAVPAASGPDYAVWLLAAYGLGAAVLLLRLLVQGASLWRLHRASRPVEAAGVRFRAVMGEVSPFSFGRAIYLNPAHHAPAELPVVLLHEQVHVRQLHSLDVLLGHLHRVLAWASPAAWLWLRAAQENLEFIADAAVLCESQLAPKQYQYSLVRLSTLAAGSALATPFSFITLKNRIRMMNSLPSGRWQLLRYAAGFALLGLVAVGCATPESSVAQSQAAPATAGSPGLEKATYVLDGKTVSQQEVLGLNPQNLLAIHVVKAKDASKDINVDALRRDFGSKLDDGLLFVFTKANINSPDVQALQTKYNLKVGNPADTEKKNYPSKALYRKLTESQGLTDAEIGGRLILIDNQVATVEQLRALSAGAISGVMVADGPVPKYKDLSQKGVIFVTTKTR
jgi:BlaR1 peptidase M56